MIRTLLVGGLSSVHDALCVAALRGAGIPAEVLPPPTDRGMTRARSLGNHGQCNPAQYAVGAVLEHASRSGFAPAEFAERHAWIAPGSCGPCRLAAFPLEWKRVLDGSGLGALHVELFDQFAFVPALAGPDGAASPGLTLLSALIAGDVLATLGHRLRPWVEDTAALDRLLAEGVTAVAGAFERGGSVRETITSVAESTRSLATRFDRVLPRVLLVGEPWTTLNDGDPSYAVARRLEELGAEVEAPRVVDWLRTIAWQRSRARLVPDDERAAAKSAVRSLGALWRLFARAAGLTEPVEDPAALGALASPWYPPDVRGGSAHLEVARTLSAMQQRSVHLVLSVKPFGCLPSSSLSDGILVPLLDRTPGAPAFVAIETTGDSHATVDSRLEMALHGATLRALDELETACSDARVSTPDACRSLASLRPRHIGGPRTFACTAAELVARKEIA